MSKAAVQMLLGMLVLGLTSVMPANAEPVPEVEQAQESLKKLKYYTSRIDGILGPKTQKAILQYQYEMNLPITGTVDDATLRLLNRPSLILNTQNFAPFHYPASREGMADGPIPQIVKLACAKAGINCRIFLYGEWRQAQEDVKQGKADGMFVIAWNSKRSKWLYRSTAIIDTEYGLFVRNDNPLELDQLLKQPSIINNYTIGVYGPSGTASSLTKLKDALESKNVKVSIDMAADDTPLFEKLSLSKNKYAVYSNRIVGESIVRGLGMSTIRYAGKHRALSYYVGFSKERVSPKLVEDFNSAFQGLVTSGEVVSIMANHSMPLPKRFRAETGKADSLNSAAGQRFQLQENSGMPVIVDSKTCLMWQQSGTPQYCNWLEAVTYVDKLNREQHAGFSDWRLPAIDELKTLLEKDRHHDNRMYIQPIFDTLQQTCWSSEKNKSDIQFVDFHEGAWGSKNQGDTNFVRAVRVIPCS